MQRPEGVFTPCNKGLLQARADDFSGGRLFYEPASADPAHSVNRFPSASSRVTRSFQRLPANHVCQEIGRYMNDPLRLMIKRTFELGGIEVTAAIYRASGLVLWHKCDLLPTSLLRFFQSVSGPNADIRKSPSLSTRQTSFRD